ncbi:hypothetical protein K438DRAFT_1961718 [Mycena galopus ATCC 62051]|nr:hypothetical protein K438DRAFT_1961718 [Mycena galopus ATCC 62051]
MNPHGGGAYPAFGQPPHQAINPAMLASFSGSQQAQQFGGPISPQQLLNGGMGGGMMNATQILQQQQRQQQMMMMNGGGGGGLNPAALLHGGGGGGGMNPATLMNNNDLGMSGPMNPQMQAPQMQITPQVFQLLATMGVTRDQLAQMNPMQRQTAMKQALNMYRQQQIHQQQAQQQQQLQQQQFAPDTGPFFDRPGSAMGMGMGGGGGAGMGMGNMGMMPQRPGTAQGMAGMRPGTAMSMHQPPNIGGGGMNMGMGLGGMNPANMGMGGGGGPMGMGPRPPSRAASLGGGDFPPQNSNLQQGQQQNGFHPGKQGTPQFAPGFGGPAQGMQTPTQQNATQGSPPPGSPFTRSKRKLAPDPQSQSPRISAMGPPPSVLRSSSAANSETNGFTRPSSTTGTPQRQSSYGPQSAREQTPQRHPSVPRSSSPMKPGTPAAAVPPPPAVVPQITALTAAAIPNIPAPVMPTVAPLPPPLPSLPPLPASVNLNPAVTRVTVVPVATSSKTIPPLGAEEVTDIKDWMSADRAYEGLYREMKTRMNAEFREMVGPQNVPWWEKGTIDTNASRFPRGRETFDVRYPYRKKEREGGRRKGARREGIRLPRKIDSEDANRPEQLVPIRLEFDVEHHKMRDTFIWNLNDPVISPEHFAQTVVEDYNLAHQYHAIITKTIQDQLSDYRAHSASYDGDSWDLAVAEDKDALRAGALEGETAAWWSAWRKRLRTEYGFVRTARGKGHKRRKVVKDDDMDAADERPMSVEEFKFDHKALQDDMRILIRLDIIVGPIKLDDQFEWDLDNASASPEGFAEIYAKELGLGGEFKTAIAHSIREQVQTYQKSLFLVGHSTTDGTPVQDDDLRNAILPSLSSATRTMDQVQAFTPQLNYLSDGEVERNEKERDKDINRRKKRNRGGRRGVPLPDREPMRTYRTPSIGFPEPDAATLAAAAAATAPMSRRAAAAAASVTIANMVASENGERIPASALPVAPMPPPLVIKEKTVKGFFKPPPYDTVILRPRAKVRAPIASTAADVSKLPAPLENDPPPPPTSTVVAPAQAGTVKKEKELVDGQRRNMINGVWHCSNCGCPESIAIGRRKGPLGDKSQCGTCGKYWHRHRRPRPIEYNSDLEHHASLKRDAELAKTMARRRGGAAALRAQNGTVSATPVDTPEPQTPRDSGEGPSRQSPTRESSPVSDVSSPSEPPLALKVKINGTSHTNSTPSRPPPPKPEPTLASGPPIEPKPPANFPTVSPVIAPSSIPPPASAPPASAPPPPTSVLAPDSLPPPVSASAPPAFPPSPKPASISAPPLPPTPTATPSSAPPSTPTGPTSDSAAPVPPPSPRSTWPPQWLTNAMKAMQEKWRNDKFEVILRKVNSASTPEWRIKCLDCPGKLYTPGPGETLSNYEVHLKNRLHRQRVNDRMGNSSATS